MKGNFLLNIPGYLNIEVMAKLPQDDDNAVCRVILVKDEIDFGPDEKSLAELQKRGVINSNIGSVYTTYIEGGLFIFVGAKEPRNTDSKSSDLLQSAQFKNVKVDGVAKHIFEECKRYGITSFCIESDELSCINLFVSSLHRLNYSIEYFADKSFKLENVFFMSEDSELQDVVNNCRASALSNNYARYLRDLPSNLCTTEYMVDQLKQISDLHSMCKYDAIDKGSLDALGMECIIAASHGSEQNCYMGNLYFNNASDSVNKVVVIGNGTVCNIRGKNAVGAAVAMAVALEAILSDAPVNMMVLTMLCRTSSYIRNGDIIKGMSGKHICVRDADSKSQILLSDAVTYAQEHQDARSIITLSSSRSSLLGKEYHSIFSNSASMRNEFVKGSENIWPLPILNDDMSEMSNADSLSYDGVREALFISKFINDKNSFAHIDISTAEVLPGSAVLSFLTLSNNL